MSFCKSCKADIVWIRAKNGQHVPADKKVTTIITQGGKTVQGHVSHLVTCPTADSHRAPQDVTP